jgi:hypothetical protein
VEKRVKSIGIPVLLTLIGLALGCTGAAAPALAHPHDGELRVHCPDAVPEGEAFLVNIATDVQVDGFSVHWLGKELLPDIIRKNGETSAIVMLGVGMKERLRKNEYELRVEMISPAGNETFEKMIRRTTDKKYPEQHLEVEKRFMQLSDAETRRDQREKERQREAYGTISSNKNYSLPLARPVPGAMSSAFGLRRFFNGVAKQPHSGLDLKAGYGDPVRSIDAGRIILTGFHYFAGGSVYIDHGQGVVSTYYHLSKIDVEEGQDVVRGELIGEAGSTGRVTGPHLHLGLVVLGQLVDPRPLLED